MTNGSNLIVENESVFTPISQLNYSFYNQVDNVLETLKDSKEVQCIAGIGIPLGKAQQPGLMDYADGIDTMQFLLTL